MDPLDDVTNGNYLRVRGEYFAENVKGKLGAELPPRARRIPLVIGVILVS